MTEHEVIWDGTPARPGGRMLFAPEGVVVPREAAKPTDARAGRVSDLPYGEVTRRLRQQASMLRVWHTLPEIAAVVQLTTDQIDSSVGSLVRHGVMEREIAGHTGGLRQSQRYRWKA